MYGTPFCTHEFNEQQLSSLEKVVCPCGNRYQSKDLREFNRLRDLIAESNQKLSQMVEDMATYSSFERENQAAVQAAAAVVPEIPKPEKPKKTKPKRERPNLSVAQWLIVVAGFMVLVAASVFVSQNLSSWNVYGWSTLELSLGLLAGFGALKSKRFSVLLSNFLAVFSSAMLLTLIMSIGTTFGWGFDAWDREPSWFWALNLGVVGFVSLGLGMWSKNFGWRAIAPLSLSASAIVLVVNSAGAFEDRWRIAVLSVVLFVVLIAVRLSRNAKWELPKGDDRAYLEDLQAREDNSLKRFGIAISILLAGLAAVDLLESLSIRPGQPLDGVATLVAAAVWLLGARINRRWVSAIVDADKTVLTMRDVASAIGLTFLGLGVLSLIYGVDYRIGLAVAVSLLVIVFALERFAKILLLPTIAVTVAAWVTAVFGGLWYLALGDFDKFEPFGYYVLALGLAFAVREFLSFKAQRVIPIYAAGLVGTLVAFWHFRTELNPESAGFAIAFAIALVIVNLYPLLVAVIQEHANAESFAYSKWIPLAQSALLALLTLSAVGGAETKTLLLSVGSGYLAIALASMAVFKGKVLAERFSEQAYVAIAFSAVLALVFSDFEALKTHSAFVLLDGLMILSYALLAKNIRWAYVGYGLTSLSIVGTSYAWGTSTTAAIYASAAIALGALVNLGLLWASQRFGEDGARAKLITRVTTGLALVLLITSAERFVPLQSTDYWILMLTPMLLALVVELRKADNFTFIYVGAALLAASPTYVGQSELDFVVRLATVLGAIAFILIHRSRASKEAGWIFGAQLAAGFLGYLVGRITYLQFNLDWNGPEVYALTIAVLLAITAWLTRSQSVQLGSYLRLDLPVLVATLPSIFYSVSPNGDTAQQNATRLLLAAAIIWAHNIWRTMQRRQLGWLTASYVSGLVMAWATAWQIYTETDIVWNGPEVYSVLIATVFAVNAWLSKGTDNKLRPYLTLDLPVLVATVPSVFYALSGPSLEENTIRLLLTSAIIWVHNLIRTRQRKQLGWLAASYISGFTFAFAVARELYQVTSLDWAGPEIYALLIALVFAVNANLNRSLIGKYKPQLTLDLPVLVATVPSLAFGFTPNEDSAGQNATRFLLAIGIIWIHNVWRTHQTKNQNWLVAQAVSGLVFAWALVRDIYLNTSLVWDGPELYSVAVLLTVLVGLKLANQQKLLTATIYRFGLPVAIAITPSVFYSWTSVTKQFSELDLTEITRTLVVLGIAVAAMVLGILRGNRGLNLVGTIELWLIGIPALWFKTSAIDNGAADLELRGLLIAAVIFWAISLLRQYTDLKLKSIVFIGIPVSIALAPAVFQTLSSLGGSEIRSLDWWRFSIVLSVSLVLLLVGALREIGGTFFPGLIGVIVTVLPYGFHPLTNREWFLWAILLGVAALLVWLAVRLENMRKAGREPSAWLKELK